MKCTKCGKVETTEFSFLFSTEICQDCQNKEYQNRKNAELEAERNNPTPEEWKHNPKIIFPQ